MALSSFDHGVSAFNSVLRLEATAKTNTEANSIASKSSMVKLKLCGSKRRLCKIGSW